jgi:hypothetical protein
MNPRVTSPENPARSEGRITKRIAARGLIQLHNQNGSTHCNRLLSGAATQRNCAGVGACATFACMAWTKSLHMRALDSPYPKMRATFIHLSGLMNPRCSAQGTLESQAATAVARIMRAVLEQCPSLLPFPPVQPLRPNGLPSKSSIRPGLDRVHRSTALGTAQPR